MKNLDCRGLACPGPVIQVKKALEETPHGSSFSIDLDTEASLENVRRFAQSKGAGVQVQEAEGGAFRLVITAPLDTGTPGSTEADAHRPASPVAEATGERSEFAHRAAAGERDGRREGAGKRPPVVFIAGDSLGSGDEKLGRILMEGFINALPDQEQIPDQILFMNAGVKLAVQGSAVLDALRRLTDQGCEVRVCGTCLEFFSLMDKLSVGTVSNMYDIQEAMITASSVVRP